MTQDIASLGALGHHSHAHARNRWQLCQGLSTFVALCSPHPQKEHCAFWREVDPAAGDVLPPTGVLALLCSSPAAPHLLSTPPVTTWQRASTTHNVKPVLSTFVRLKTCLLCPTMECSKAYASPHFERSAIQCRSTCLLCGGPFADWHLPVLNICSVPFAPPVHDKLQKPSFKSSSLPLVRST